MKKPRSQYQIDNGDFIEEKPTREKISKLGNRLVETTDEVLRQKKKFLSQFNKVFEFVYLQTFIFEEADYEFVIRKEVSEIREIFKTFDIRIKELKMKKHYS